MQRSLLDMLCPDSNCLLKPSHPAAVTAGQTIKFSYQGVTGVLALRNTYCTPWLSAGHQASG